MRRDEEMTNYEMIKEQSSLEELARFLCLSCDDCEVCIANMLCYKGHNGMKAWLEKECDENE